MMGGCDISMVFIYCNLEWWVTSRKIISSIDIMQVIKKLMPSE